MWHVDALRNSLITAGNGGTGATHAAVTLFYNNGKSSYTIEKQLEPGEQIWANIGEIIREQIPDKNGKTIPTDVMMGSYELRDLDHIGVGYLYEGKLVIDKNWGHGYYGCAGCCGYETAQLNPYWLSGGIGTGANDFADGQDMCSDTRVDVTSEAYDWASTNSAIVNVANAYSDFVSTGSVTGSAAVKLQQQWARLNCPVQGFQPQNTQTSQCAYPTNFKQTGAQDMGDGVLQFTYSWASSTGKMSDLAACGVTELVNYPGTANPYPWPNPPFPVIASPNPTITPTPAPGAPGPDGVVYDTQRLPSTGFPVPSSNGSFTATQYWRYQCSCVSNNAYQNIDGPLSIVRSVYSAEGSWYYSVAKSGETSVFGPITQ